MFPRKTMEPDKAAELEQRLRSSQWWNQVSAIDRHALEALWQNPKELVRRAQEAAGANRLNALPPVAA